ncbi:MAG: NADH-quinone oxidoreductase subunit NuoE [Proteobacteria bacterium]|nr:NADH-quinone oxidoreductase subunit NuoE [Pseudomonadota bacterium]
MEPEPINWSSIADIIKKHQDEKWGLIPLLQEIQETVGYIPPEAVEPIAQALKLSPSHVQGVITFYSGLATEPKGKCVLKVCRGTACHVKGGKSVLNMIKKELNLEEGKTSQDYKFTLETVACLGACFLAPTLMANRDYYGKLSPKKITSILDQYGKLKGDD